MDIGVAPAGGAQEIKFGVLKKTCKTARITGAKRPESVPAHAQELWEELGMEEEPAILVLLEKLVVVFGVRRASCI